MAGGEYSLEVLEHYGLTLEEVNPLRQAVRAGDKKKALSLVTPTMANTFCIVGDASACLEKVRSLERAGLTCNKNGIPFDPEKPTVTSGVRLGSPAATTRGFGPGEFRHVGELIAEVLDGLANNPDGDAQVEHSVRARVSELCARFPIYGQA